MPRRGRERCYCEGRDAHERCVDGRDRDTGGSSRSETPAKPAAGWKALAIARESVCYCAGKRGSIWEGFWADVLALVLRWSVLVYRSDFVISTAVILNGGYNYTFANVYTKYINQPHGKGARGACVSRKEHTPHEAPIFIHKSKKWGAICGAILSKMRAARYRSHFGVYGIVLKTLLFFRIFPSKD